MTTPDPLNERRAPRKHKFRVGQRVWVRLPATIISKAKFTWQIAVAGKEIAIYPDEVVGRRSKP